MIEATTRIDKAGALEMARGAGLRARPCLGDIPVLAGAAALDVA